MTEVYVRAALCTCLSFSLMKSECSTETVASCILFSLKKQGKLSETISVLPYKYTELREKKTQQKLNCFNLLQGNEYRCAWFLLLLSYMSCPIGCSKPTEQPKPKTKGSLRKRKLRKVFKGVSYSFQTFAIFAFISFMGSAAME